MARRLLTAAFLVGTALILPVPAMAQEGIIKGLMSGLGLVSPDEPEIDYRERPPLVVPKSRNSLPPPASSAAARNSAWPVDPDVERRKQENDWLTPTTRDRAQSGRALSQEEIRQGRRSGAARADGSGSETQFGRRLTNEELGAKSLSEMFGGVTRREDETMVFKGEPDRKRLTEPPPSYRTPSAKAAYGPRGLRPYDPQGAQNQKDELNRR